jgi:hypothetical protein
VADTIVKKKLVIMSYLDNILFAYYYWVWLFFASLKKIKRNINLGIDVDRKDNPGALEKYGYDNGTVKMVKDA